jgi:phage tail sheath gpL-like
MPDNVSFNAIPVDIRTPGQYIEIDNSKALTGLPGQVRKILVLGQRLATGSVPAATPTHIFDSVSGAGYFGNGSQLAQMISAAKAANPYTDMWAMALDDLVAGVAATGTLTITGSPTLAGTLNLYVAGVKVPVGVAVAEANATTATNIVAAINAIPALPVTATSALGVVTLTARHKGLCGNDIDVRLNYYDGDATPAGLTAAIVALANGTGNPDVTAALTALGGDQYYTIITPWTDAANMAAVESYLDTLWGPMKQKTGHVFGCVKNTLANLTTYGTARNSPHSSILGIYDLPTAPWVCAASWGAVVEFNGAIDPARPFTTLLLPGIQPPPIKSRFRREDRDVLLRDGISTYTVNDGGSVQIERVITTYQTNATGIPDVSYLDLNTKWTVDYIRYAVRARMALRFPRMKLADDGTNFAPGQAIVTPSIIRGELICLFRELEYAGLVENLDQFKQDLLVVRSTADVNRINAVIPPNLINQFQVFAASVQFRL